MRVGIWSRCRATTPIEQTDHAASSGFDPGGEQCALRTSETAGQHTVHCCSHCHVTTTATYFELPPAPVFDALPHLTTSTTSTTSTSTTLRLQHLDDDSPSLRTASTADYHYNCTTPTTPTTNTLHLLPLQLLLTPPLLLSWRLHSLHYYILQEGGRHANECYDLPTQTSASPSREGSTASQPDRCHY